MKTLRLMLLCACLLGAGIRPAGAQEVSIRPEEKNFADTIPVEFFQNWIIIPVTIHGKAHRFIFDTGASYSVVRPDMLPASTRIVRRDSVGDAHSRKREMAFGELCGLSIGKLRFPCYPVLLHSTEGDTPWKCAGIDGFIGGDILQCLSVKIDKRKKQLIWTDRRKWFKADKGASRTMKVIHNRPFVEVQIGKVKETDVLFDTGDNGSFYSLCRDVFHQLKAFKPKRWKGEVTAITRGVTGFGLFGLAATDSISRVRLPEWKLNGIRFGNVETQTCTSVSSRIGAGLLDYGQVILDYPQRKFVFVPYQEEGLINVPDLGQYSIGYEDGHIFLSLIWGDSDLYRQGARQGDRVLEINRIPLEDDLCRMMEVVGKGVQQLKLMNREGEEKEFFPGNPYSLQGETKGFPAASASPETNQ